MFGQDGWRRVWEEREKEEGGINGLVDRGVFLIFDWGDEVTGLKKRGGTQRNAEV
jgi:hypothetical protein